MGLDITHYKAKLERPITLTPYYSNYKVESEFEYFDVSFIYFEKFIQLIDVPEVIETIIFPKKENEIEEVKEFFKNAKYNFLFEKDMEMINSSIESFIQKNNLTEHNIHTWEATQWFGCHFYKFNKQIGFYYDEVGYQRKGMNGNFSKKFYSDDIYCFTKKEDFEFALNCVDFYWDSDTKEEVELRKKLFKENFIDKYELNQSWMSLSY